MNKIRIAILQVSAAANVEENINKTCALINELRDIDLIALPEIFAIRGSDEDYRKAAESLDGPTMGRL